MIHATMSTMIATYPTITLVSIVTLCGFITVLVLDLLASVWREMPNWFYYPILCAGFICFFGGILVGGALSVAMTVDNLPPPLLPPVPTGGTGG